MRLAIAPLAALAVAGTLLASTTPTAAASDARLRVLHASPDAPAVDIYVDGAKALADVPFGTLSDYLSVPAGDHQVQVFAAGTTTGAVIDATITLQAGTSYTVAATNALASIQAQVIEDDPAPTGDAAQLRAVHLSADAPAVDVAPRGSAVADAVVTNLAYPDATGYLSLPAGSYELDVRLTGTTTVALELPTLDLAAGTSYSAFVIGSAASPAVGSNALRAVVAVDGTASAMPNTSTAPASANSAPIAGGILLLLAAIMLAAGGARRLAARRVGTRD